MQGSFKALGINDVFLSDYSSQKEWSVGRASFDSYGIQKEVVGPDISGSYNRHKEIEQLFYSNTAESGSFSGPFDIDLQTSLTIHGARKKGEDYLVYSIPRECFGTNIIQSSFKISIGGVIKYQDFQGVLIDVSSKEVVGDIIYTKGLIIIPSTSTVFNTLKGSSSETFSWISNVPIFTYNIKCSVPAAELNFTFNPTAKRFLGNSSFTPYITTVGLYNDSNELVAVAKLSKPIKKASNIDTTFKIQIDL